MTRLVAVAALCGSILLGGCATTGGPGGGIDLAALAAQVQQITTQACRFLPTAQTVANIVSAGFAAQPFAIANAICAAVTAPPTVARGKVAPPHVGGVVVRGRFV